MPWFGSSYALWMEGEEEETRREGLLYEEEDQLQAGRGGNLDKMSVVAWEGGDGYYETDGSIYDTDGDKVGQADEEEAPCTVRKRKNATCMGQWGVSGMILQWNIGVLQRRYVCTLRS